MIVSPPPFKDLPQCCATDEGTTHLQWERRLHNYYFYSFRKMMVKMKIMITLVLIWMIMIKRLPANIQLL